MRLDQALGGLRSREKPLEAEAGGRGPQKPCSLIILLSTICWASILHPVWYKTHYIILHKPQKRVLLSHFTAAGSGAHLTSITQLVSTGIRTKTKLLALGDSPSQGPSSPQAGAEAGAGLEGATRGS